MYEIIFILVRFEHSVRQRLGRNMEHVNISFTDRIRNENNDANGQYECAAYKYIFIGLACYHLDFDIDVFFFPAILELKSPKLG